METHVPHPELPHEFLGLLRSVESIPPGNLAENLDWNLDWAMHCTRQQAVLLLLQLPQHSDRRPPTLEELQTCVGISIESMPDMPTPGTAFYGDSAWHIFVNETLDPAEQVRRAVHELKHVIDHPARRTRNQTRDHFDPEADEVYEALCDAFTKMVLGPTEHRAQRAAETPAVAPARNQEHPVTERRNT